MDELETSVSEPLADGPWGAPADDGKRVTYHEEDDKVILRYTQDVEPVLKLNHEQRAAECSASRIGEFHQTMRVPEVVMLDIRVRYGWDYQNPDHWPMVKSILKGPEYAAFRTTNRRI
jgi:hypothetical protein